jgi:hypothetical protein
VSWPFVHNPDELEASDPDAQTLFEYRFGDNGPLDFGQKMNMAMGMMPEMHVWVAMRQPGSLLYLDMSTPLLPEVCKEHLGLTWTAPMPSPLWQWATSEGVTELPHGWSYEPIGFACVIANFFACKTLSEAIFWENRDFDLWQDVGFPDVISRSDVNAVAHLEDCFIGLIEMALVKFHDMGDITKLKLISPLA